MSGLTIVTCPACDAPLQPLSSSSTYLEKANQDLVKLGIIHVQGPLLLFPVGPLVAHHATVHPHLPLRKFLRAADIGRF